MPSSSQSQSQTQTRIKITFLAYKKPHLTDEEFARRWTAHGIETARILKKHGALEYTQQHVTKEDTEKFKGILTEGARRALVGWDDEEGRICDGVATMIFKYWEGLEGFLVDDENKELARRDTPGFTDYTKRKMVIGNEIVFLRDEQ